MRKIICILLSVIAVFALTVTGCKKESVNEGKTYYSFTISETEVTLDEGETHGLICSYGDKKILYTTSDDSVATVSADGTITAVRAGEAYITATVEGAENESKICKVTVVKFVYTVEIDRGNLDAVVGAKLAFNATVYKNGEETGLAVSWSVTPSATVEANGNAAAITFAAAGEYTLRAIYGNSSATITVKVVSEIGGNE